MGSPSDISKILVWHFFVLKMSRRLPFCTFQKFSRGHYKFKYFAFAWAHCVPQPNQFLFVPFPKNAPTPLGNAKTCTEGNLMRFRIQVSLLRYYYESIIEAFWFRCRMKAGLFRGINRISTALNLTFTPKCASHHLYQHTGRRSRSRISNKIFILLKKPCSRLLSKLLDLVSC